MSGTVNYRTEGVLAVLEVDNPPVNALSSGVRYGFARTIKQANEDPNVTAIVIFGKGRTFPAGADIREFGNKDFSSEDVRLTDVCNIIENSRKPVVAALHGTVLGGGFEIAISCHFRVAARGTRLGFPEVEIGILPGATGTQRFPRLTSLKAALDLIPSGRHAPVEEVAKMGAIDKIVENKNELLLEAMRLAKSSSSKSLADRRTSQMKVKDSHMADELISKSLAKYKKKGTIAPIFCIKAVRAAVDFPFEEGVNKELEYAMYLFQSGQAKALQYAFFAQRAAMKWELQSGHNSSNVKPIPFRTGAVIGAGTMGTGIAMAMLNAGIPVVLVEQNQTFLDKGVNTLHELYAGSVKLGKTTRKGAEKCLSLLKTSTSYNDIRNVDVVIEAVYENMALKKEIFSKLDQICKPDTFLWSNTSTLDIDEIASATKRPEKVLGTHFFVPAYHMKLLENIRGAKTAPECIATATEFGKRIGKENPFNIPQIPILVGNCQAFVGNRMNNVYGAEARFLVEEGCLPHEVDQVLENFGFPLGPFKVSDLSGLDVGWKIAQELAVSKGITLTLDSRALAGARWSPLGAILASKARLGRKSGKGWYKYEKPNAKVPFNDQDVTQVIQHFCQKHGIKRRQIGSQEIQERCLYSMINEGFKILEEGIASKPEDIDTIWFLGYGYPKHTGGPMYYATQIGLKRVYERICYYYEQFPTSPHWQPSFMLKALAHTDTTVPMKNWTKVLKSKM